ncbi:phospholipid scramblase 2-like [Physella acuta]|uniref:phospholipid scramblase 2-like n=1 Tax=Physella acuta TaxID=109671 RepID=UPI0027DE8C7D|nr:phospholipid scramblase 2-like [Physella acuta]XP_059155851.1 phospholipid scramblase 2-like [Physella acuta]XP_059155852.1 phospholipid scramblase 2-like [Physella acuta]
MTSRRPVQPSAPTDDQPPSYGWHPTVLTDNQPPSYGWQPTTPTDDPPVNYGWQQSVVTQPPSVLQRDVSQRLPPPPPPMPQANDPWMARVGPMAWCPPGLEYLTQLDQVIVKQDIEVLELLFGVETENSYKILNRENQQCYKALEESGFLARQFCGNKRGFKIFIRDNFNQTVITLTRPFKCCSCGSCCACEDMCQDEIEVTSNGYVLGSVRQNWACCSPLFSVMDQHQNPQFEIVGPVCTFTLFNKSIEFTVNRTQDGREIGAISKYRGNIAREMFTDADTFGVTFPIDLDVRLKALLLGCVFLIDFKYFEDTPSRRKKHR